MESGLSINTRQLGKILRLTWPSLLAIVVVALVSFPLLRYGDRQWRDSIEETVPVRDNVLLAKSYLSKGFLFLEKRVAGDETIRIDDVLYLFSQAGQLIQDSIEGKSSITILHSSTPTDPELIDKLEQLHLEIKKFQDISRERWEKRELPDAGVTTQQRSSFYLLEYMANDITFLLDQKTGEALERQSLITSITLSIWIVTLLLICYLLLRAGIRRWFAEEKARYYQNNLEGLVKERTDELTERMKELSCLYEVTTHSGNPELSLDERFQKIADVLPLGWQYPEITCAKITVNDKEFKTKNYRETEWKQSYDIEVHGVQIGTVEVCYLEAKPEIDEGPFIKEERRLIDTVADRLSLVTAHRWAEQSLTEEKERLEVTLRSTGDGVIATDIEGKLTVINRVAEQLTGWTQEEAIGKPLVEIFHIVNENTRKRILNPV
ncbi:PAS domain-containing protein [Chloroflexota bacterium]